MTELYRHYDSNDCLLYVGISLSTIARLKDHKLHSEWFSSINKITVTRFQTREDAITSEEQAIKNEFPLYNIKHNLRKSLLEVDAQSLVNEEVEKSRLFLTARVVSYKVIYSPKEVADVLGTSSRAVNNLLLDKKLGHVTIPARRPTFKSKVMITGWQLLEYLEQLQK